MRIAFIFADFSHKKFEEDIDVVSREFGTFPPLGICFAAAIAEQHGHETLLVDAHAERLSPAGCLDRIRSFDPRLLGFLLTTYMFRDTMRFIRLLKRETGLPVLVGNVQMELFPTETLGFEEIDYGIMGSAVEALPVLLSALDAGRPVPDFPGLCYRRDGEVVINPPRQLGEDFSLLPLPKRESLPHPLYHSAMSKRKNVTNMVTAKGCPSRCTFCHIHRTPYSARSPERVCDEMEQCITRFGIREFEIFDPSFTIDRKRITALCEGIVERGLDLDFACRARVDQVDPGLLCWMARAGCRRILYGIESGSERILRQMKKGITLEDIRRAVRQTQDAGIMVIGFFLVGAPGETIETIRETVRFALGLGIEYAQFHKTMAKPRTELYELTRQAMGQDYWREYVLGNAPEMRLPSPWTELSQQQIEREAVRAYHSFYLRPSYILRTLAGIRSLEELYRYLRSGVGMLKVKSDLV